MSTISLPYEKQIRHILIFDGIATETTVEDFVASASPMEIALVGETGQPHSGNPSEDLLFVKKNAAGNIVKSDLITPKDIVYLRGTAPRAKVGKIQNITVATAPVVGVDYFIDFKLNYATSEENFVTFMATTRAVAGDTVTTIATRLAKDLSDQFNNSIYLGYQGAKGTEVIIAGTDGYVNKYFKITVVAGVITIQEKDFILTDYVVGLRAFDQLMWNAVPYTSVDGYGAVSTAITVATVPGVYAKNQGYQIMELENYLASHIGEFQTPDVTLSFNRPYESSTAETYYTIDLKYSDVPRTDPLRSDKMLFIVSTSMADINTIGQAIADASGLTWTDFV